MRLSRSFVHHGRRFSGILLVLALLASSSAISNAAPPGPTGPVSEALYAPAERACLARYHDGPDALVVKIDRFDSSPGSLFYQPGLTVFYQASRTPANDQSAMAPNEPYTCRGDLPEPFINVTTLVKKTLFSNGYRSFSSLDGARAYCSRYWKQDDPTVLAVVNNPPPLPAGKTAAYATEFGKSSEYFAAGAGGSYRCKAEVVALYPDSWIDVDQIGGVKITAPAGVASSYEVFRQKNCPSDTVVDRLRDSVPALGKMFTVYLKKGDRGFNESAPNGMWVCLSNIVGPTTADFFDLADRQTAENARVAQEKQEIQHPTRISKRSPADFDIEHLIGYCAQRYGDRNLDIVRQVDAAGYVTHTSPQYASSAPAGRYGDLVCGVEARALGWANRDAAYAVTATPSPAPSAQPKVTLHYCPTYTTSLATTLAFATLTDVWICNAADVHYNVDPKTKYVRSLQFGNVAFPLVASGGGNLVASGGGNLVASGGGNIVLRSPDGAAIVAAGKPSSLITNDGGTIITHDGGSIITHDGGSLIGQDGASFIGNNGGAILGNGGTLLRPDALASLVSNSGGTVVSHDGGSIAMNNGASMFGGVTSLFANNGAGLINLLSQGSAPSFVGNNGGALQQGGGFKQSYHVTALGNDLGQKTVTWYTPDPDHIAKALTACHDLTPGSGPVVELQTVFAFPASRQWVKLPDMNDPKFVENTKRMLSSAPVLFACKNEVTAAGWTQYTGAWPPPQPAAPVAAPTAGPVAAPVAAARPPAPGTSPGIAVHRLAPSGYYLVAGQEAWQFTPEQVSATTAPASGVPTSFTIGGSTFYLAFSGNDAAIQVNGARVSAMGFGTMAGDAGSVPRSDVLPRSVVPVSTLCRFAGAAIRKAQQTTGVQPGAPCAATATGVAAAQPIPAAVPPASAPAPANGLPAIKVVHADATPATGMYMIDSAGEAWVFQKADVAPRTKAGALAGFSVKGTDFDVAISGPMAKITHGGATIIAAGSGRLSGAPGAYKIDGRNVAGPTGDIPVQMVVQFFAANH